MAPAEMEVCAQVSDGSRPGGFYSQGRREGHTGTEVLNEAGLPQAFAELGAREPLSLDTCKSQIKLTNC